MFPKRRGIERGTGWRCLLIVFVLAVGAGATKQPPYQEPVNFNDPPREYTQRTLQGWTVRYEEELAKDHVELAEKAAARLDKALEKVLAALPSPTHQRLKKLPIFLMYGEKAKNGGRNNGAEYFAKTAPEHFHNLDPRMADSVLIYSAENYVALSDYWTVKLLIHEFAHAWHLQQWPEEQEDIMAAYEKAMQKDLYCGVKEDNGAVLDKAYGTVNQLEYFAELSCAYYVGLNYEPFTRDDFKKYDPDGYGMIEKMWARSSPVEESRDEGHEVPPR